MGCCWRCVIHAAPSSVSRDIKPERLLIGGSSTFWHHSHGIRGVHHWAFRNIHPPSTPHFRETIARHADAIHQESAQRCRARHHDHEPRRQTKSLSSESRRSLSHQKTSWNGQLRTRHETGQLEAAMVLPSSGETIRCSQQHKQDPGWRSMAQHREAYLKKVNEISQSKSKYAEL